MRLRRHFQLRDGGLGLFVELLEKIFAILTNKVKYLLLIWIATVLYSWVALLGVTFSIQFINQSRRKSSNLLPDIAETSAKGSNPKAAKKIKKEKAMRELKVNVSLLANDDGIGSLPHTPTHSQVSCRFTRLSVLLHR